MGQKLQSLPSTPAVGIDFLDGRKSPAITEGG
jgi:hypothetical protein